MIESNINFGNQTFNPCKDNKQDLKYGISITDECISLAQTDEILNLLNKN
jgi:phospho-2-dehydro-3-deoxyheptonate aldolase